MDDAPVFPMRILLAEGDAAFSAKARGRLREVSSQRIQVDMAGRAPLFLDKALSHSYDLIFLDTALPGAPAPYRTILRHPPRRRTPLLALLAPLPRDVSGRVLTAPPRRIPPLGGEAEASATPGGWRPSSWPAWSYSPR